jgi:hypothetical protein
MQNWSSKEELFPGVWVYRNVSGLDMNLIQRLENLVEESKGKVEKIKKGRGNIIILK